MIVIAAGLKAAQAIVVPMLLAAFIATIAASPMFWFKSKGMSNGLALGSVVLGIFFALGLIAALLTQSTSAFSAKLPFYQERLAVLQSDVIMLLHSWDIEHWTLKMGLPFIRKSSTCAFVQARMIQQSEIQHLLPSRCSRPTRS